MKHLQSFPDTRKATVMQRIMSLKPSKSLVSDGDHDFEKSVLKLRRDGFRLIDLQRHDTAFSTVWYRKGKSFLGLTAGDAAMLLWEMQDSNASTTVMTWRVWAGADPAARQSGRYSPRRVAMTHPLTDAETQ